MSTRARWWSSSLVVAALLSGATASRADESRAEALFREGHEALRAGDDPTACARFDESRRLDPAAIGPLVNFADCEAKRGRLASALAMWRQGRERMMLDDPRLPHATARIAELAARVPTVTVRLDPQAPRDTGATIDGAPVRVDQRIELDPGEHVVRASAAARAPFSTAVRLAEREHREVAVLPGPRGDEAASSAPPAERGASGRRTAGFVIGGVGIAALAFAGVTGVMALSRQSTVDTECDEQKRCSQKGLDAGDEGRTLVTLHTVGLLVGAAGLATGLVLILTAPSQTAPAATATIALGAAPNGVAVRAVAGF